MSFPRFATPRVNVLTKNSPEKKTNSVNCGNTLFCFKQYFMQAMSYDTFTPSWKYDGRYRLNLSRFSSPKTK